MLYDLYDCDFLDKEPSPFLFAFAGRPGRLQRECPIESIEAVFVFFRDVTCFLMASCQESGWKGSPGMECNVYKAFGMNQDGSGSCPEFKP